MIQHINNANGENEMKKVEKFNVRIVKTGDKYGRNDCLVNDKAPMVEFYDSRHNHSDFDGRGQFVSRYYISTLTTSQYPNGLCLDGGIPEWSVSADGMKQVLEYIQQ
jgi:hypothetical protein